MERKRHGEVRLREDVDMDFFFELNGKVVHLASLVMYVPKSLRFTRNSSFLECKITTREPGKKGVVVHTDEITKKIGDGYDYIKKYDIADELEEIYGGIPSFDKMKEDKIPLPVRLFACSNHEISQYGIHSYSTIDGEEFFRVTSPKEERDALLASDVPHLISIDNQIEITENNEGGMPICFKFK